jgi:hypothetical protein
VFSKTSKAVSKVKTSAWDYVIILIVFAVTGSSAAVIGRFLMDGIGLERGWNVPYMVTYVVVMTLIYPFLLLGFAFVFGKYAYFLEKQKILGRKIMKLFGAGKKTS